MKRGLALALRIAIALVVIGGVVWWVGRDKGSSKAKQATGSATAGEAPAKSGDRVVPVQLATVTEKDFPIWLEGLGTVAAFQQVTVRAQVDGRLDKVLFTEGQVVKAGEVIAQIDPRPFMVQLHTAQGALARDRAQFLIAKRNYERYQGLQQQQLVAQQQVDKYAGQVAQFEGAVKIDLAAVEQAQLQLDYAQVKSPLTGTTGVRVIDAGNLVKAADTGGLVVITAIDPAAVLFTISQDRLGGVSAALAKGESAWSGLRFFLVVGSSGSPVRRRAGPRRAWRSPRPRHRRGCDRPACTDLRGSRRGTADPPPRHPSSCRRSRGLTPSSRATLSLAAYGLR